MFIPIEFQKAFQKTEHTAFSIEAKFDSNPALMKSRFGGTPYWQKNTDLPKDEQGELMALLVQINCSDVPTNEYLPTKGILQIFIPQNDESYGANLEIFGGKDELVSHYWENPDEQLAIAWPVDITEDDLVPVFSAHALSFSEKKDIANIDTIECAEALSANPFEVLEDVALNEKEEKLFYEAIVDYVGSGGHKLLGHPNFIDGDPRENSEYRLLLQIDTDLDEDNDIMWGDNGIGQIFIRCDDLRVGRFDRLILYWDC